MKLPNGYGSVYKLSGKRRKPWAVRITTSLTIDHDSRHQKQERKIIGYYETRQCWLSVGYLLATSNFQPLSFIALNAKNPHNQGGCGGFVKLS